MEGGRTEIRSDTTALSPFWRHLLAHRIMDEDHHSQLGETLEELTAELDGLKWTLLERYWELVSGECVEWAKAAVSGGEGLRSAVSALFLPLTLLQDLLATTDDHQHRPLPPLNLHVPSPLSRSGECVEWTKAAVSGGEGLRSAVFALFLPLTLLQDLLATTDDHQHRPLPPLNLHVPSPLSLSGECVEWAKAAVSGGEGLRTAVSALFLPLTLLQDLLATTDDHQHRPLPPLDLHVPSPLSLSGECVEWAKAAVSGGKGLRSAVSALFLPLTLLQDLLATTADHQHRPLPPLNLHVPSPLSLSVECVEWTKAAVSGGEGLRSAVSALFLPLTLLQDLLATTDDHQHRPLPPLNLHVPSPLSLSGECVEWAKAAVSGGEGLRSAVSALFLPLTLLQDLLATTDDHQHRPLPPLNLHVPSPLSLSVECVEWAKAAVSGGKGLRSAVSALFLPLTLLQDLLATTDDHQHRPLPPLNQHVPSPLSLSVECVEWTKAAVSGGEGLRSAVSALFLPVTLLQDLLATTDDHQHRPLPPLNLHENLQVVAEAAWKAKHMAFIKTSLHSVHDSYKTQVHRMGSPAVALELLNKVQVELMRIGRWSEGLEMPATKLLLPITGLLLSRLEDLITQKGFSDAKFLWTIPPQVELVIGQVSAAIATDLSPDRRPPPLPLHVDWSNVQRILAFDLRNPLRDATVVGRDPPPSNTQHPLHPLIARASSHTSQHHSQEFNAALDYLHRYMESMGKSEEERRATVELRVKTENLLPPNFIKSNNAHSDKGIFSGSPSEDSGFESFAHSPNSTFSFD